MTTCTGGERERRAYGGSESLATPTESHRFHHEALLYAGDDEFVTGVLPFVAGAVERREPTLVVVSRHKIALLRRALGPDADRVEFADMAAVGRNPARIIPAWRDFVGRHAADADALCGVGEPVFAERTADEVTECQIHEVLLNVAFAESPPFRLLCPYDTTTLDPEVVGRVGASHRTVVQGRTRWESGEHLAGGAVAAAFDDPLPAVPVGADCRDFDLSSLRALRNFAAGYANPLLPPERIDDLLLAVSELAANSVSHGGGIGILALWHDDLAVHADVRDRGRLHEPLVGRVKPTPGQPSGRGLWIVNQVCDLVQVRTGDGGTTVRIHMERRPDERRSGCR